MRRSARTTGLTAALVLAGLGASFVTATPALAGVIQLSIGVASDGSGPFTPTQQAGG